MDKVRFGRALGYGARHAARTLASAAEAAVSPDPRQRRTEGTGSPAANPPGKAASAKPSPSVIPPPKRPTVAAAFSPDRLRQTASNARRSTRVAGVQAHRSFFGPLATFSSVVSLQVTGTFFALLALFAGQGLWKLRGALRGSLLAHTADTGTAWLHVVLFALFSWFAISSFVRASRRSRR